MCAATASVTLKLEATCEALDDLFQVGGVLPTDVLDFFGFFLVVVEVVLLFTLFLLLPLIPIRQIIKLIFFFLLPYHLLLHRFQHLFMVHIIQISSMPTPKELTPIPLLPHLIPPTQHLLLVHLIAHRLLHVRLRLTAVIGAV